MKYECYVLGLLKFKNDEIVFKENELKKIKNAIEDKLKDYGWLSGSLEDSPFKTWLIPERKVNGIRLPQAKLHYYHHRVIIHFADTTLINSDFSYLRKVRDAAVKLSEKIMNQMIKDSINSLLQDNEKINPDGEVEFYYMYPLILVKNVKPCSFFEQISSLAFEIVEPFLFRPFRRKLIARISIPCMTVYSNRDIKERLIIDIINAVYQYCLYEKKIEDIKNGNFSTKLSEHNLIKLWEHMLQTMGGKFYDNSIIKLSKLAFAVSLLAIILTVFKLLLGK